MPRNYRRSWAFVLAFAVLAVAVRAAPPAKHKAETATKAVREAQQKGLDWLTKNQAGDGSWSKGNTLFAALALSVPEGRLSVYNRTPPKLPKDIDKPK